mmetsp:Transcript_1403/g.2115  ORF Transcript_1403/g.2115 Transcript_1403/m.2115 type:complete len:476 (+) Transcript_1403:93-1520(+)
MHSLSFWRLLGQTNSANVRIPDTVIIFEGVIQHWLHTAKDGILRPKSQAKTSLAAIKHRIFEVASQQENADPAVSPFIAVMRSVHEDGQEVSLLLRDSDLSTVLDRITCIDASLTCVLQAYVRPVQDMRFVCTSCQEVGSYASSSFARTYSERYRVEGDLTPCSKSTTCPVSELLASELASSNKALCDCLAKEPERIYVDGLVCEYIHDVSGKLFLLDVLHCHLSSPPSDLSRSRFSTPRHYSKALVRDLEAQILSLNAAKVSCERRARTLKSQALDVSNRTSEAHQNFQTEHQAFLRKKGLAKQEIADVHETYTRKLEEANNDHHRLQQQYEEMKAMEENATAEWEEMQGRVRKIEEELVSEEKSMAQLAQECEKSVYDLSQKLIDDRSKRNTLEKFNAAVIEKTAAFKKDRDRLLCVVNERRSFVDGVIRQFDKTGELTRISKLRDQLQQVCSLSNSLRAQLSSSTSNLSVWK